MESCPGPCPARPPARGREELDRYLGTLVLSIAGPAEIVEPTPAWAFDSLLDTIFDDPTRVLAPILVTVAWTGGVMLLAVAWFSRKGL